MASRRAMAAMPWRPLGRLARAKGLAIRLAKAMGPALRPPITTRAWLALRRLAMAKGLAIRLAMAMGLAMRPPITTRAWLVLRRLAMGLPIAMGLVLRPPMATWAGRALGRLAIVVGLVWMAIALRRGGLTLRSAVLRLRGLAGKRRASGRVFRPFAHNRPLCLTIR